MPAMRACTLTALFALACACDEEAAPPPKDDEEAPPEPLPLGCEPGREMRAEEASPGFAIESEPWCAGCPFEDQASLVTLDGGYNIAFDASGDEATLLAMPSWQDARIMTQFDLASGWSDPVQVPLGHNPAFGPAEDGRPWLLSLWIDILRLREPTGVEEDLSCDGARFSPAAVDVHDGVLQVVAGLEEEDGRRVALLTRPLSEEEPPAPWEIEDLANVESGPLEAARDADGNWLVLGITSPHAVFVHEGGQVLIPLEAPSGVGAPIDDISPDSLDIVVGDSFAAAVLQGTHAVTVTFVDGRSFTLPAKRHQGDSFCDFSTSCGGRCALRERVAGRVSVFAAEGFVFVAHVETSIDVAVLNEDVLCPDSEIDICECREVIERQDFSSQVVVARFDTGTLHGERILSVPIPVMFNPTLRAGVLGDRVLLVLRADLEGPTRMGTLPLSALVP